MQFSVDVKGKVGDIIITRGLSPELDQEVIRVIESAPDWKPGLQGGQPVKVQFTIPVLFSL